jgi:hypothetical protein
MSKLRWCVCHVSAVGSKQRIIANQILHTSMPDAETAPFDVPCHGLLRCPCPVVGVVVGGLVGQGDRMKNGTG